MIIRCQEFVYVSNYRLKIPIVNHLFSDRTDGTDGQAISVAVYISALGGHETKVYITDGVFIYPSVRAEKNSLLTVNCRCHRYRRYRG